MNKCAPEMGASAGFQPASLALCAAQRAFAASFEVARDAGEFRAAQLRGAARRTLSALSADDRARLADWFSLLLATRDARVADAALGSLARIDVALVARVRRVLPQRVQALAVHGGTGRIVAA